MAKATLKSHIYAALNLVKERESAYLAIGKSSPWLDDLNPPNEDENTSSLSEVIGYKKVKQFSLARPLRENEIIAVVGGYPIVKYSGDTWVLIPTSEAYVEGARWVYIEIEIDPKDLPEGPYRQVGVHFGLIPRQGVTKGNLLPSDVQDEGVLQFYENREPQSRTRSVHVLEQFMIKV